VARHDVTGSRIGRIRWAYDRGGRDTLRAVLLNNAATELSTRKVFDAEGRLDLMQTNSSAGIWYSFNPGSYDLADKLLSASTVEPNGASGPSTSVSYGFSYTYEGDGTGRLTGTARNKFGAAYSSDDWSYDVFGNRLTESPWSTQGSDCSEKDGSFGPDNQLERIVCSAPAKQQHFASDAAGNRLFEADTTSGSPSIQAVMSYTAGNQLYFSLTPTAQVGTYDQNWHWYDGQGMRVLSFHQLGGGYDPLNPPTISSGPWTHYIYDGSDVALTVVHAGSSWYVDKRYLVGGLDDVVAGRFSIGTGASWQDLALVNDRQGSTLGAMRPDGSQETQVSYFSRNPFGALEGASGTGGEINTETGFTGASTPNPTGGFTYLRNRWYDAQTGRFLTQDPIGLAGGVNLYAYAGNDPISFSDPFGTCPPWPDCIAQGIANWGARHGGVLGGAALYGGAALNAGFEATGINAAGTAGNDIGSGHVVKGLVEAGALLGGAKIVGAVFGRLVAGATDAAGTAAEDVVASNVKPGATLYRVYGGEARAMGRSWSTVPPDAVADFRAAAGLPTNNSGGFVIESRLKSLQGIELIRSALPGPTTPSGALQVPEILFQNPPVPGVDIEVTGGGGWRP